MLTYSFANTGSDSMYEYLYKCIRNDITQGKIKQGRSCRQSVLCKKSGHKRDHSGKRLWTIISRRLYLFHAKAGILCLRFEQCDHGKEEGQKGTADADRGSDFLFCRFFQQSDGQRDLSVYHLVKDGAGKFLNDNQKQLMINPPCGGILELRQAIARYLKEFRAMQVEPEQIIIGAGTEYLHGLLIQLLGNHRIYGVENPGYHKIARIYEKYEGRICQSYAGSGWCIHPGTGRKKSGCHSHITVASFPNRIVMPVSRRYELLGWAAKSPDHYIIEDDYDSELRLTGKPFPTLQSIDVSDRVIYMNTFTKTLASTVRISYMVLPLTLTEIFYQKLSFYSCTVSNFEQYTLAKFMENGSFEKHINRLRNYYQTKRDAILQVFQKEPLGKYVTIREEGGGCAFLMQIHTEKSEEEIVTEAKGKGIKLAPLSHYFDGEKDGNFENTYVINYSSVDLTNIEKAAQILYRLL